MTERLDVILYDIPTGIGSVVTVTVDRLDEWERVTLPNGASMLWPATTLADRVELAARAKHLDVLQLARSQRDRDESKPTTTPTRKRGR